MSRQGAAGPAAEHKSVLAEFRAFLLRGNIVELAVAVVIGAAAAAVVKSLVSDLLLPLIGAVIGTSDFSNLKFTLGDSVFHYGNFIDALVSFFLIAAAIFFFVIKPTEKLGRLTGDRADDSAETQDGSEVELLTEIRDLLAERR